MAHELEIDANGNASMFYTGQTPWHGLGIELPEAPSIKEAIFAAGLNWQVELKPLFTQDSDCLDLIGKQVPAMACVRSTDKSILGVVGTQYRPLQNADAFQFFQPFVDNKLVNLETAGSLQEGKRVWILARIVENSDISITKDDIIRKFILLSNSHDGTMSVRVGFTPIRVVCANTLALSHNNAASKLIRLRHGRSVVDNLAAIRDVMNLANQEFEATAMQFRQLASRQINRQDLRKYIKIVLDVSLDKKEDELSTKQFNIINDIERRFDQGIGQDLIGTRGTIWAAYNAVTEYLSYEHGRNNDSRLNSLWFGNSATVNQKALTEAIKLAA